MTSQSPTYCLISPCRDEAAYMRRTLDSVLSQSVPPTQWVIVDDGSTDQTPDILAEYASRHDCLTIVRRENRGQRRVGPGVVDAFYAGYEAIDPARFDYLAKLDLDLVLPPRYFEHVIRRMEQSPTLGTFSGKPYYPRDLSLEADFNQPLISEKIGDEMSAGMIKFYRRHCFEQIGGFVRQVMWDGIDCHRCRMLGWQAASADEPELRFIHLRPMGSSQQSIWVGRMRHGFGQYFMGTGPAYMAVSALYRMTRPPYVLGGLAMGWGYFRAMIQRQPRYDEPEFRRFLRRYQWACLLQGKPRATARLHERAAHASASASRPPATAEPARE